MRPRRRWALRLAALLLLSPVALQAAAVQPAASTRVHGPDESDIRTLDHVVPLISTVPANKGEQVQLFVRERVRGDGHDDKGNKKRAVLMVSTSTQTVALQDLSFENYSWMAFLAEAGFDVFAMDLTGYGLSPRPKMDDPCNASFDEQQRLLTPNPLKQGPCLSSYPFRLTTAQTDWDEIDTVVEYIRELREVEKVSLIGWSLGGPRMGGYAARHPEKVEKLFLLAPLYNRTESSVPPGVLPERGLPMTVRTVQSVFKTWDSQVRCENQFTPAIRDTLRSTILEFDPLAAPGEPRRCGGRQFRRDGAGTPRRQARYGPRRSSCVATSILKFLSHSRATSSRTYRARRCSSMSLAPHTSWSGKTST